MVVGDDEQVSPAAVGQNADAVQALVDEHLQGIPNSQLYDGTTSVYDLAGTCFGAAIRLVEHYRCVPEIISFSNHLSYGGDIKPLRDSREVILKPHTLAHHVQSGKRLEGTKENREEALEIASLIAAATEMTEYHDKTIGVISMVGDEQALLVERLLRDKLPVDRLERHKILCGNSAQFQGDERDVMFLSLVDSSPLGSGPLRFLGSGAREMYKKRYNVAASRAKDQMWVVHSMDPSTDLQPGDLRRELIQHARDPMAKERHFEQAATLAESEFEKDVMRDLIEAGYRVEPQVRVGRLRIDMVIQTEAGKVAIECDGDRFHGIEQLGHDMERQAILERSGWRFIRIRGSQYYRDSKRAMKAMIERLNELGAERSTNIRLEDNRSERLTMRLRARAAELRDEWTEPSGDHLTA